MLARTPFVSTTLALVIALGLASTVRAQVDPAAVPTATDTVERGIRLRADVFGRYNSVGLPDPPVRLEVDDVVNDDDDIDVSGLVIFGWDRPANIPLVLDFMGDISADVGGDSPVSPFLDQASVVPQARLFSAFIGLSGAPGEALEPYKFNLGRMTEIAESPITYDGVSLGGNWTFPKLGRLGAKLWGGIDAPQYMATDPFSRVDQKAYQETYIDDSGFVSPTGGFEIQRNQIDLNADGVVDDAIINPVGGLVLDGRFAGVGFVLSHTLLPTLQRSKIGASYLMESDALTFMIGADLKASDFIPRAGGIRGDLLTGDGTTRVGLVTNVQFLEDICAYDCSFRAFNTAQQFNQTLNDNGQAFLNDDMELLRVKDQIRHFNIGPAQEHVAIMVDVERQLPFGVAVSGRGRLRQHFNDADLDYFRSNIQELGLGASWSTGFAMDIGADVAAGFVDTNPDPANVNNGLAFDLIGEGLTSYIENRLWVRSVLLEGTLSNLSEVFVRRQDIQTKGLLATGQWSASLASTLRYDVLDFWSLLLRLDADALSPVDTLNGSGYLGAIVGTSVRF